MSFAFLSSYSLKTSYQKLATHFDNFDFIMMIVAPLMSYLVSETLNISGLLSLMTCAFVLSLYGKKNLEKERSFLFHRAVIALSYTSRSICDMFMGIAFALSIHHLLTISVLRIGATLLVPFTLTFAFSYLVTKYMYKKQLLDYAESRIIVLQSGSRGILVYTLAL